MILSFYYLKIAVSLDISALYHSKIQALFYILFNAGVSNFDINKAIHNGEVDYQQITASAIQICQYRLKKYCSRLLAAMRSE